MFLFLYTHGIEKYYYFISRDAEVLKSFIYVFTFGPHNDTDMTFHS